MNSRNSFFFLKQAIFAAFLVFPIQLVALDDHYVILRVVNVTPDWYSYYDERGGGWPAAVPVKETENVKFFEIAIWEEINSVHLYEFSNEFDPHLRGSESVNYRESFALQKYGDIPEIDPGYGPDSQESQSKAIQQALMSSLDIITKRFPDSKYGLVYSGHGGPGGALFASSVGPKHAYEMLVYWSSLIGRKLSFIDMGGPCNKGSFSDLATFCPVAEYYIASDLANGGYTFDDWTFEKYAETAPDYQWHALISGSATLEEALIGRVDLKRKAYEYSVENMTENKTEQANYLFLCETFNQFSKEYYAYITDTGKDIHSNLTGASHPEQGYLDMKLSLEAEGNPELLTLFNNIFVHQADNRDFFEWETPANGLTIPRLLSGFGESGTINLKEGLPELVDYPASPDSSPSQSPTLSYEITRQDITISWTAVDSAESYTLLYAPYPQASPVSRLDLGSSLSISGTLPIGSSFYVAVLANIGEESKLSNIEHFEITDQ